MKKPSDKEESQQHALKRTVRRDAEEVRQALSESHTENFRKYIEQQWSPPQREIATRQEQLPDGTIVSVKFQRVSPHSGLDTNKVLEKLLGHKPTRADFAAGAAYAAGLSDDLKNPHEQAKEKILDGLTAGNLEVFFDSFAQLGPQLLRDAELNSLVEGWWLTLLDPEVPREEQGSARKHLKRLGELLWKVGKGNKEALGSAEKEEIISDCKKWLPICEDLNKAFKKLWQQPEYGSSELQRKETRGTLAEQYSIPVADVEAIEWSLKKPSGRSKKSTPTIAMCHRVARDHPLIGEKTVEKIWNEYTRNHSEWGKKRKAPTTPIAERTP